MLDRSGAAVAVFLLCASSAHAGTQLFEGSWSVKAHGNERTGGTGESAVYSAFGLPQGVQCNPFFPRCPLESTPTDGSGNFAPLGGTQMIARYCAPWANWQGMGTTLRPAKGETATTGGKAKRPIPPLYRNPAFFTSLGAPNRTSCTATSTGATPGGKGLVQAGRPITGAALATTSGTGMGGFGFAAAALTPTAMSGDGLRATGVAGEFHLSYAYGYSYTYATLRNAAGVFAPGSGPGSFNIVYRKGGNPPVASIRVTQGAAKFGGTMRMLGALTSKVCIYRLGGCSRGTQDWLYDAIGTAAPTLSGVVTQGYPVVETAMLLNSAISAVSTLTIEGARFPWTTGSVTVTAVGRGPHKTVHYAKGYDNRTATSGKGIVQLVSPTLTRWLQPAAKFETGGIAILRLRFVPEPRGIAMLVAGVGVLAVARRWSAR